MFVNSQAVSVANETFIFESLLVPYFKYYLHRKHDLHLQFYELFWKQLSDYYFCYLEKIGLVHESTFKAAII